MSEYQKIKNPITNRFVSTNSYLGKKIIQKYMSMLGGGSIGKDMSTLQPRLKPVERYHSEEKQEFTLPDKLYNREEEEDKLPIDFHKNREVPAEEELELPVERYYTADEELELPVVRYYTADEEQLCQRCGDKAHPNWKCDWTFGCPYAGGAVL